MIKRLMKKPCCKLFATRTLASQEKWSVVHNSNYLFWYFVQICCTL